MRSGPERPNQESGREPRKRWRLQTQPTRTAIPPALRQYSPHRRASLRRSSSPPLMSVVYAGHYEEIHMIPKGSRPRLGTPIHVGPLGSTGTPERSTSTHSGEHGVGAGQYIPLSSRGSLPEQLLV